MPTPPIRASLSVSTTTPSSQESTAPSSPVLDFIASDETLDRYGDVITPAGWRLDNYRRNPVFQNSHQYGDIIFTLGKALSTEVRLVAGRPALCQRIQFATDVNPIAKIAYGLYMGKFLNAVSVGFVPIRWSDSSSSSSSSSSSGPRRKYLEQELLEVSSVAIPANPNALVLGLKSGAIEKGDLRAAADLLGRVLRTAPSSSSSSSSSPAAPKPLGEGGSAAAPLINTSLQRGDGAPPLPSNRFNGFSDAASLLQLARTLHSILKHS